MERGLRSQLKIYDDFSMFTPEQMEELLDKIEIHAGLWNIEELKLIRREEVEPNGTDKETVWRFENCHSQIPR